MIYNRLKASLRNRVLTFLGKQSGRTYVIIYNTILKLQLVSNKIKKEQKGYSIHWPGKKSLYFFHEKQGVLAYNTGILKRAQSIANDYNLNEINFEDNDIVIDCGANVGDFALYFDLIEKNIDYHGFEPSNLEFVALSKNILSHNLNNQGLWKEEGQLQFFLSSQNADSSLIKPSHYDTKLSVDVTTLDKYINASNLDKIKLLKLEAEGAEPEILEGAKKVIKKIEYITADLGFERGVEESSTLPVVVNLLIPLGFELLAVNHTRVSALFKNVKNYGKHISNEN